MVGIISQVQILEWVWPFSTTFLGLNCSGQSVQQSCQYSDTQVIIDQMAQQNIPK